MKKLSLVILASWALAVVASARPLLLTIEHWLTPAEISNLACDAPSSTEIHCTADTDKPTTLYFQYQIAPIGWLTSTAATSSDRKAHDKTIGSLAGGLTFYVRAKAVDDEATESYSAYINVVTPNATAIPVLSGFANTATGTTSATFTWTTDIDSDSQVECGTSTGVYTLTSTLDATLTQSHGPHTITGLSQGTTYYCRGISDAGVTPGYSSEVVVMTGTAGTLAPPVLGDIISHPSQAANLCIDADSDGACEAFRFMATLPRDTSGWTHVDLGASPTRADVQNAINAASGCTVIEWSGTVVAGTSISILVSGNKCIELAGKVGGLGQIELPAGVAPTGGTSCANDRAVVVACGTFGSTIAWNGGYSRDSTVLTVADTSGFQAWSYAAPYGDGMYVSIESDHTVASCPERYQKQLSSTRDGSLSVHRVVSVDSSTQLTIWPPVPFDHDAYDPSCANYQARALTLPLMGVRNVELYSLDGDYDDVNGDTECMPYIDPVSGATKWDNGTFCLLSNQPLIMWKYAQGWLTESVLHDHINVMARLRVTQDLSITSNEWYNPIDDANWEPIWFNSQMLHLSEGASVTVLDNWAHDVMVWVKQEAGAQAVAAHNYCTNTFGGRHEKCWFQHGVYAKNTLLEVNDLRTLTMDNFWGQNGPHNAYYRNAIRTSSFNPNIEGFAFEGFNLSTIQITPDSSWHGNFSDRQFDGGNTLPFEFFDDTHSLNGIGSYNWSSGTAVWGSCSSCTLWNNTTSATQPAAHAAASAPPTLFCFEDPANPMACEDRLWPPYWCQEGADFTDVHNSIGAFSATQGDLPAKRRANSQSCTLCDSVGGSGC